MIHALLAIAAIMTVVRLVVFVRRRKLANGVFVVAWLGLLVGSWVRNPVLIAVAAGAFGVGWWIKRPRSPAERLVQQLAREVVFATDVNQLLKQVSAGMNELVALGTEALPAIHRELDHPNVWVRRMLLFALNHIGDATSVPLLQKRLNLDTDNRVAVIDALAASGDASLGPKFVAFLGDDDRSIRKAALCALARHRPPEAIPSVLDFLRTAPVPLRADEVDPIIAAVGVAAVQKEWPRIAKQRRLNIVSGLEYAELSDVETVVVPLLEFALDDRSREVAEAAMASIEGLYNEQRIADAIYQGIGERNDTRSPSSNLGRPVEQCESAQADSFIASLAEQAEAHIAIAKRTFQVTLDYSEDSVAILDQIIDMGWAGGAPALPNSTIIGFASYFGETIRRNLGGEWILGQKGVELSGVSSHGGSVSPFAAVRRRFADPEAKLIDFYRSLGTR